MCFDNPPLELMRLNGEYSWLKQYVDLPNFWVEDVLSWDESFNLALADSSFFTFATSTNLAKTYVYLDSFTKSSFLDILLLNSSTENTEPAELYEALLWDLYEFTYASAYASKLMWYTDSQTFCSVALHHSLKLISAVNDFFAAYASSFPLFRATTTDCLGLDNERLLTAHTPRPLSAYTLPPFVDTSVFDFFRLKYNISTMFTYCPAGEAPQLWWHYWFLNNLCAVQAEAQDSLSYYVYVSRKTCGTFSATDVRLWSTRS